MNTRYRYMVVLLLVCLLIAPALLLSQSASARFEQGLLKENAEGTLNEAIVIFRGIAEDKAADPAVRAKAQLHVGICYEKLGDAQARGAYERLIADFPQQTSEVTAARARLSALKATPREASSLPTLRLVLRLSGATAGTSAAVSPDGGLLAYVNWESGDLAVRDLRLGQSRMVTKKGGNWETDDFAFMPRWSPDGKRIAYFWYRDDGHVEELRITDLSGKNVRVLHSDTQRGLTPVGWFPDGRALLATRLREGRAPEIVRVSIDDGAVSPVEKLGSSWSRHVCLSPDGRYIAFDAPTDSDSLNMDVFVMPSSGGPAAPVATGPYDDQLLGWTPDGRRVFFASNRSGAYDAWAVPVDSGSAAGSPQLLRKEFGMVTPIGFAPDDAFYFAPDIAVRDVMFVDWNPQLDKATSAPTLATDHFSGSTRLAAWSHDGRKLAYLVDRGGDRRAETRVRVRDIETGAERTLVDVGGPVYGLSWSPDGTSVALTTKKTPQSPYLCQITEVDSGKILREVKGHLGEGILRFLWGPDASVAYYTAIAPEHVSLRRLDLRTGDETSLYTHPAGVPMDIAVSPEGRHIAFGLARQIMLIAATGGEPRELGRLEPPGYRRDTLAWSPDGSCIYVGRWLEGTVRLHRVAVTGGAVENLNLEIGDELRFRPDGRRLAFTRRKDVERAEIWVIENFLPETKEAPAASTQKIKK